MTLTIAQRFGLSLRKLREGRRLTQQELAERMGWHGASAYQNILHWEKGARVPDLVQLYDLARVLRCTMRTLVPPLTITMERGPQ